MLIIGSQYPVAAPEKVQKEREFESQKEILRLFQMPFSKEEQEQGTGQAPQCSKAVNRKKKF